MAESEKGDSSTSKAKGKTKASLLDEDISKDFLSSWKSMSMTGDDDMDFNFEPVTKGNKKPFDFGKMDMDFSLDGDFGKVSSFNVDVPDLDFSSSPKKSTKSIKKSEDESAKGNRRTKQDEFAFSFDFNGLDDFNLDAPSTKGKNPNKENSCKDAGSKNDIECEDLPGQVSNDIREIEDTQIKQPLVSKDAAKSKPEELVEGEGIIDASPLNCPSKSEIAVDQIRPKGTQVSSEMKLSVHSQEMTHQDDLTHKTSSKNSYDQGRAQDLDSTPESNISESVSLPASVESANEHECSETKTMSTKRTDEENHLIEKTSSQQSYAELKVEDQSATFSVKSSAQSSFAEEVDIYTPNGKLNDGLSEACTLTGGLPDAAVLTSDTEKLISDNLSPQCSTDQVNVGDEKNELGDVCSWGNDKPKLTVKPLSDSVPQTLHSQTRPSAVPQRSALKVFTTPSGSGSTLAKPMLTGYQVSGAINSNFSMVRDTSNGGRTKLSVLDRKKKCTADLSAEDGSKAIGKKLQVSPGSCSEGLINQDLVSENTDKNVDTDTVSTREGDYSENVKIRNEMGVETVPHDGQAMRDRLSLESEKKVKDFESSGFRLPPSVPSGRETKYGNKGHANFKNKISSIWSIQKSNASEVNKLSSLRIAKKLPSLPNLKISSNYPANKHSPSPIVEEKATLLGVSEKSIKLQAMAKTVPPVGAEKQRHSPPSLKRKPSEAAYVGPTKLHQSGHLSPSESRMSKELSSRQGDIEVHSQSTPLEEGRKNVAAEHISSKFDFHQEQCMEDLGFISLVESDANVEKAEACTKELELICNMLKKKHEEAKELLVRALVNNNNLLMLDHPIYEDKIHAVQRFADRLMSREVKAGA